MADSLSSRRILANRMSSVARNHVDKTYESTVCFQRTIRKAVALSFRRHPAPRCGCRLLRLVLVVKPNVASTCQADMPFDDAILRRFSRRSARPPGTSTQCPVSDLLTSEHSSLEPGGVAYTPLVWPAVAI